MLLVALLSDVDAGRTKNGPKVLVADMFFFFLAVAVLSGLPPGGDAWLMPPPPATIGKPQAVAARQSSRSQIRPVGFNVR